MNTPLANQAATVLPGSISFVTVTDDDDDSSNLFTLGTGIAYRIIENLYGGLNIGYGRESGDDFSSTIYLVGPQVRYYVPIGKTSAFLGANAAFGKQKFDADGLFDSESDLRSFGGVLGLAYPLGSKVDIEGQITYDTATATDEDDDDSDVTLFGFRIGFAIRL